ncbi:NAD-dependent epimerase/dehydratase family protein [Catenuloplanes atrovinosus]|uniref:Nucleoside-diphosphate-sugar epimerase n=1 Tax=Catenuloplanes atrovinosus TaxID=137266 RepID=A0AAE3YLY9_9ACTN|nr:NAD-dependent epimerase/dehydratase family protein [Catenuloplanes atrovinosus]MDR7274885.1 nucleoside-diphosphate-sugar epimerase [Catenuloplanes atrovinosus]
MVTSVLVTGGSGVLGGALVARFAAAGLEVSSVDLRPPANPVPGVRYETADIRDRAAVRRAMAGVRTAVHCAAALPSYPAADIRSIIVDGTGTVLGAAREAGLSRVVHISSTAVYGLPDTVPTTEEYPHRPVDAYTAAKAEAERVVDRFRADGLPVPVLRPKTFVGPGRMGLFAMLFEWADEGRHFPVLGRGDVRIQMCAMDDLVDAVSTVLTADEAVANDTYNIAAERFGTIREDFQAVLDAAGHGRRVVSVPARPAVALLGLLRRTGASPVYDRLLHKLLADSYVSIEKAKRRLGFAPRYSNRDALLRTYAWWRENRDAAVAPASAGRTSNRPWRQGALSAAKVFF